MSSSLQLDDPALVAALIDHTLLSPKATSADIDRLCEEAANHEFASVCINPFWVRHAAGRLSESKVKVCTVIGFPLGANLAAVKSYELESALNDGATELDMVLNVGAFLSGEFRVAGDEIQTLAAQAHASGAILKVILETCLLTDGQKVKACELAVEAGADFVKTSTGFSQSGATVSDVALMRKTVGAGVGVKASGGVRTLETLRQMVSAGATRIGTSSGLAIIEQVLQAGGPVETPQRQSAGSTTY